MTKWEQSCIEALITSPIAFKIFRLNQKNQKRVDQFINKIWPYRIRREKREKKSKVSGFVKELKDILEIERMIPNSNSNTATYEIKNNITLKQLFKYCLVVKDLAITRRVEGNNIIDIRIRCARTQISITITNSTSNIPKMIYNEMTEAFLDGKLKECIQEINIRRYSGREGTMATIEQAIESIQICIQESYAGSNTKKKQKRVYTGLNIGIEIEYEGIFCDVEKEMLKLQAIEFNSGYDGGFTNGRRLERSGMLRENRLRLNGHRSLPSLWSLLVWMNQNDCAITQNSGLHLHIDMRHNGKMEKAAIGYNATTNDNYEASETKLINNFFGYLERMSIDKFIDQIRKQPGFQTYEYRMCMPTLNYPKMILQILACIHINERKNKQLKLNEEYMIFLTEQYKSLDIQ